jgi:hypothetical protein
MLTSLALAIMLVSALPTNASASWWPWKRHHHSCGCVQVDKCGVKSYSKCNKCDPCDKCAPKPCEPPPPPKCEPVEKCHYVKVITFDECGRKIKTKHLVCETVQPKCSKCDKCNKCG